MTRQDDRQPSKQKRRWYQYSMRTLFLVVGGLAILLGLALHYRVHLLWQFASSRVFDDVRAVPTRAMPKVPVPEDWVHCQFGSLSLDLPRAMAVNADPTPNGWLACQDGSRTLWIALPDECDSLIEWLRNDRGMPSHGHGLSLPRLRLACYQVSSDDFRWSMTRQEASWHTWCIAASSLLRFKSDGRVEWLFRDDLEGIVDYGREHAVFDWQATTGKGWAYLHFRQSSGNVDPTWVRPICRSLRFSGEIYPDRIESDQVQQMFQIVEQ